MDANNKIIRFIDADSRELFSISDGGSIKITFPPDDVRDFSVRECKYIDEYHFGLGIKGNSFDTIYNIVEFAEQMEKMGAKYEPLIQLTVTEQEPSVMDEIRAAQKAPKPPKPKQERSKNKNKDEVDL